jgi:hypothetical protein
MAVEGGNGGSGAGAEAKVSIAAELTVPGGNGFVELRGGTTPFNIQHTLPATHAVPPMAVYSGCGLLYDSATHVDVWQHRATQSLATAVGGIGHDRKSPPLRSVPGGSNVAEHVDDAAIGRAWTITRKRTTWCMIDTEAIMIVGFV